MTDDKWECISIAVEQDSYIDTFICPWCSALVKDQNKHSHWHTNIGHRIDDAGSMYLRPIG